jgi:Zn-dependent M28 family amino/carboxypeptidase
MLAEREVRGEDSPGANDNASGVAAAAELACELAESPLESTRVVLLVAGCEESGLLGTQAFLRSRDTSGWLFLNVDSVGGPGNLRYLAREGIVQKWDADPGLVAIADRLSAEDPSIGLSPADGQIGLTYDATAAMARGGRAITLVAERDGVIPNYHWTTDTPENLDPAVVTRALAAARGMAQAIDRGEAD